MTIKTMHTLNYWWDKLRTAVDEAGRDITAGELAKYTGTSRATAHKYLMHLKKYGTVCETRVRHNAKQKKSVFHAIGVM